MENAKGKINGVMLEKMFINEKNILYELQNISVLTIDKKYNLLTINKRCRDFLREYLYLDVKEKDNIYELSQKFVKHMKQYETVKSFFLELQNVLKGTHMNTIKIIYSKEFYPQYFQIEYIPIKYNKKVVAVSVFIVNITEYEKNKFELLQLKNRHTVIEKDKIKCIDNINMQTKDFTNDIKNLIDMMMNVNLEKKQKEYLYKIKDDFNQLSQNINNMSQICMHEGNRINLSKSYHELEQHNLNKNTEEQKKIKVLIADDNSINKIVVNELLKKNSCICNMVSNGKEVLEKLKENKYDLIFMDISMPIMDGVETTKVIRKIEKYKNIQIIAMTAYEKQEDIQYFIKSGMNAYLPKPIVKENLYEIINKYRKSCFDLKQDYSINVVDDENIECFKVIEKYLDGNSKLVIELAEKVIVSFSEEKMQYIKQLLKEGNIEQLKELVHKLKGIASSFRLNNIEKLLQDLTEDIQNCKEKHIITKTEAIKQEMLKFAEKKNEYEKNAK